MEIVLNISSISSPMDLDNSTLSQIGCSLSLILTLRRTIIACAVTHVLVILPLLVFVLFLGCQRWLKSSSMLSHPDVFTYNMLAMEMIQVLANITFCLSLTLANRQVFFFTGVLIYSTSTIKAEFLMLTCVELYFAVVFPIIHLRHKNSAGVTIRNISICCVWVNCILYVVLSIQSEAGSLILYFLHQALLLLVICFCCISVLWTLKQAGPGNHAKDKEKVDQSKLRAFHNILIIMAVLLLSLGGVLVCDALNNSTELIEKHECFLAPCSEGMSLLSSLVLPLLFLQRAGKLPGFKPPNQGNK